MPCRVDDWDDVPRATKRHGLAIEDFEAVLCGMLTVLEKEERLFSLDDIDWDEVGVSRKMVEAWWEAHKKEDERRRAKELAERVKEERRKAALAKLTDEDRKILGL